MTVDAANLLPILSTGDFSTTATTGLMPQGIETAGFSSALLEQLSLLRADLAGGVKADDLAKLPADTQAAMQSVAALFGKNLPQAGNLPQNIDLDDTMQTLADVMQQLQSLATPVKTLDPPLTVPAKTHLPQPTAGEDDSASVDAALLTLTNALAPPASEVAAPPVMQDVVQPQVKMRQLPTDDSEVQQSMAARLIEVRQQAAQAIPTPIAAQAELNRTVEQTPLQQPLPTPAQPLLRKTTLASQMALTDVKLTPSTNNGGDGDDFERRLSELLQPAVPVPGETVTSTKTGQNVSSMAENLLLGQSSNALAQAGQPVGGEPARIDFAGDLNRLTQSLPNQTLAVSGKSEAGVATPFSSPQWGEDLGQQLIWMHKQALPSAELRLNPEHLGPVLVKIDQHQDQTSIIFTAQHQAVRDAIESAIPKLREMFSGQQLQLADVNVSQHQANAEQRQPREFFQNASNEQQRQARRDADTPPEPGIGESFELNEEVEAGRVVVGNGLLSLFA